MFRPFSFRVLPCLLVLLLIRAPVLAQEFEQVIPLGHDPDVTVRDLAVDPLSGHAFVAGSFRGAVDFDGDGVVDHTSNEGDGFLAKYNEALALQWVVTLTGASNDAVESIALDRDGHVYVTGMFSESLDLDGDGTPDLSTTTDTDVFIASFADGDGPTLRWARRAGGVGEDIGMGIGVSPTALLPEVYITGGFEQQFDYDNNGTVDFQTPTAHPDDFDVFVARFHKDTGTPSDAIHLTGTDYSMANDIAVGSTELCITGAFAGTLSFDTFTLESTPFNGVPEQDAFIACFTLFLLSTTVHESLGAADAREEGIALAEDQARGFYLTGTAEDLTPASHGQRDAFLARYDLNAGVGRVWTRVMGGAEHDAGTGVFANVGTRQVYVTGNYTGAADFDEDGVTDLTAPGTAATFLALFDDNGSLESVQDITGMHGGRNASVRYDASGTVYLSSFNFSDALDFDGDATPDFTNLSGSYLARYEWVPVDMALEVGNLLPFYVPGLLDEIIFYETKNLSVGQVCVPKADGSCKNVSDQFKILPSQQTCDAGAYNNCIVLTFIGDDPLLEVWVELLPENPAVLEVTFGVAVRDQYGSVYDSGRVTMDLQATNPAYGDYDIYTIDVQTGKTNRVTSLDGMGEFNPDWSPDGTLVVHDGTVFDRNGVWRSQDLYVTKVKAGTSAPLAGGEGGNNAAFSPDGQQVLFDRCPLGSGAACDPTLYVVSMSSSRRSAIRTDAQDGDWSPNGRAIVFYQPSDQSIRTRELRRGQEWLLAEDASSPAWSADGKYIAYVHKGDLFRIPVSALGTPTGASVPLAQTLQLEANPAWSPSSQLLVFNGNSGGDWAIYTRLLRGAPSLLVAADHGGVFDPAWSPDGRLVAYAAATVGQQPNARAATETMQAADDLNAEAYPNPFNPVTTLRFHLPEAADVRLEVFDLLGRRMALLTDARLEAGAHTVRFDAAAMPSGTYFYRVQAGHTVVTKHLTLIK